jgi:hypothetical protein
VFDKPNKDAVVRSLSAIVGKADEMAAERRFSVQGDPNNSRTLLYVAKAVDEVHAELLEKAMELLASYVGQVDASPKEMTTWARPELEKMAAQVLGQIRRLFFRIRPTPPGSSTKHFEERLDLTRRIRVRRVGGRAIEATPSGPRRSQETPSARPDYVSECGSRHCVRQLRANSFTSVKNPNSIGALETTTTWRAGADHHEPRAARVCSWKLQAGSCTGVAVSRADGLARDSSCKIADLFSTS